MTLSFVTKLNHHEYMSAHFKVYAQIWLFDIIKELLPLKPFIHFRSMHKGPILEFQCPFTKWNLCMQSKMCLESTT